MLNDEQFNCLLREISLSKDVAERLIRIETIVRMNSESYQEFRDDLVNKITSAKVTADKAHERIDLANKDLLRMSTTASVIFALVGVAYTAYQIFKHSL